MVGDFTGVMLNLTAWSPGPRSLHCKGRFFPLQLASILLGNSLVLYEYPIPKKLLPYGFSIFALNNYHRRWQNTDFLLLSFLLCLLTGIFL